MTDIPEEPETGAKTALLGRIPTWVKDFSLVALILVIAWKIATADFKFDLTGFRFTDVLALVLAIAAVGLSALFYFKATETSNRFYDNTYKFTKDISETLGRIEERFGAGLEHLHESSMGIQKRVEQIPIVHTAEKLKEEITTEQEKKKKSDEEKERVIEKLMERAKLENKEKAKVFQQLVKAENEAQEARDEIQKLRSKLESVEGQMGMSGPILEGALSRDTRAALAHLANRARMGIGFHTLLCELCDHVRAELVEARILCEGGEILTPDGAAYLAMLIKRDRH